MARRLETPGPGRRERNKREKLERIQRTAIRLFRKQGFAATTTRQIADEAGIATGTLFLYVKSKEELLFHVFREAIDQVVEEGFRTLPRRSLLERYLHLFDKFIAHYARDAALARLYLKELMFLQGEAMRQNLDHSMGFIGRLAELASEAQARGELASGVNPMLLAANCFGLYVMALLAWLSGSLGSVEELRAMLRASLELQMRGALPHKD